MISTKSSSIGAPRHWTARIASIRPRGDSASSPVTRNVGQCGRHSPHATHVLSCSGSRCSDMTTSIVGAPVPGTVGEPRRADAWRAARPVSAAGRTVFGMTAIDEIAAAIDRVRDGYRDGVRARRRRPRDAAAPAAAPARRAGGRARRRRCRDDLGKSAIEAYSTEIGFTLNEIDHALNHVRSWTQPQKVAPADASPAGLGADRAGAARRRC